jgi:putative Holliday junction resolvase
MSTSPVRYLCVDLGDKRTGLAVSDSVTRLVTPLEVLEVPVSHEGGEALIRAIVAAARELVGERGRLEVVVGLPLVQEGKEGPRAKQVRSFAERVRAALGCPLHFQDETLTSVEADWSMARSGMTRGEKKARRDALAAAVILRDFLAQSRSEG